MRSASLAALVLAFATSAPAQGLVDRLNAQGSEGERGSQPVANANASVELEVVVLPQGDKTQVGDAFRFDVTVVGDPVRDATNVALEVGVLVRRGPGQPVATDLRIERAVLLAREGRAEMACGGAGDTKTCDIGALPAKGEAKASITIRTRPGVAAGQIVLSARALAAGTQKAAQEALVELSEKARLSNVGLSVAIESDSDVGAPGLDIGHKVRVYNSSEKEDATEVVLLIRQRITLSEAQGLRRLPDDQFKTTGRGENCALNERVYRCALGTIPAKGEKTVQLETAIAADLPARRWGRLETQARVKSAELDPDPGDNFVKRFTDLVSRQPELAFLTVAPGADGRGRFVRQDSLANGQFVTLAARYPHVLVEPGEVVVKLSVDNGAPMEVRLRPRADGKDRVYRSEPFVVLAPQDGSAAGGRTPLRAAKRSVVKLMHGKSELAVRVE